MMHICQQQQTAKHMKMLSLIFLCYYPDETCRNIFDMSFYYLFPVTAYAREIPSFTMEMLQSFHKQDPTQHTSFSEQTYLKKKRKGKQ